MKTEMKIKMSKGVTVNLGNFNSFRVDFEMEKETSYEDYALTLKEIRTEIDRVLDKEVLDAWNRVDREKSKNSK